MPDQDRTRQALEALTAECAMYVRILELTRKQRQLAESGNAEDLLSVLAEKGKLTEDAARISEESHELKNNWGARATQLAAEDAARGQQLLDRIAEVLKEILAEEDACQGVIGKRREGAMEDLLRLQKGKKIARAYGQKPAEDPRFKDERK